MHDSGDGAGPTSLMAGADPESGVAVEVLVEEEQVPPVRVLLERLRVAVHGTPTPFVTHEDAREPLAELLGHLVEGHLPAGAGGTLDLEVVSVI